MRDVMGSPSQIEVSSFRRRLISWYDGDHRDLPWRKNRDPYRVWVSEIMLQQTRVAAVLEHYRRFLERFPTVGDLARAREASVLTVWSGLGYYRRARNLHAAAKKIVNDHSGKFPTSSADWEQLPGIGRYTAAAIASIAFGEAVAVVDGNVQRVLQRVTGERLAKAEAWLLAGKLVHRARPGDFNQAMMELGATVCLPKQPLCSSCPVRQLCCTRGTLPELSKEIRVKKDVHYGLDLRNNRILMVQRSKDASVMPGMWELPEIQRNGKSSFTVRHSIMSTDYVVHVSDCAATPPITGRWIRISRVAALPLTGLSRKILAKAQVIPSIKS